MLIFLRGLLVSAEDVLELPIGYLVCVSQKSISSPRDVIEDEKKTGL